MITKLSLLSKKPLLATPESSLQITTRFTTQETIAVAPSQRESPAKTNRGKAATMTMRKLLDLNVVGAEEAKEFFHSWISGNGTDILTDLFKLKFGTHWIEHYQRIVSNIFIDGQEVPLCDFTENLSAVRATYETEYQNLCTLAKECGCLLLSVALNGLSITLASKNPCALEAVRYFILQETANTGSPTPYVFLMRLPAAA